MDLIFLFKGLAIGFLASIPLGPVGILCIQRTINKKLSSGFVTGLGISSADTTFAIIALFFLSLVLSFIEQQIQLIASVGGALMMVLGVSIFFKSSSSKVKLRHSRAKADLFSDFISGFFLTLTNFPFIFVFIGLFTSFGINSNNLTALNGVLTIAGVLVGASVWWSSLSFSVHLLKSKFKPRHLILINRIAGILIFVLGLAAICSAVFDHSALDKMVH